MKSSKGYIWPSDGIMNKSDGGEMSGCCKSCGGEIGEDGFARKMYEGGEAMEMEEMGQIGETQQQENTEMMRDEAFISAVKSSDRGMGKMNSGPDEKSQEKKIPESGNYSSDELAEKKRQKYEGMFGKRGK